MAWGGAGGGFGPSGTQMSAAAGLPFAGIPEELVARVERILDQEPEHPTPTVAFDPVVRDRRPFTLRRFLGPHWRSLVVAGVLVVLETVAIQAGPLLTQQGIDHGVSEKDKGALITAAVVYLISVVLGALVSGLRVAFTGRLGERLTEQLRVRVFAQLQRLSLDFFTEEKVGRLMTRMTSDIDALTALFQDGLVNLAVQILSLAVIAAVLVGLNPLMAIITLLLVMPVMVGLTLWFRTESDRGYLEVRDRIAEALADLQETLSGIRIITATNRRRHNVITHRNIVGRYRDANVNMATTNATYSAATEAVGSIGQAMVLLIGGKLVLDNRLTIGELTAFVLYLTAFFAPIQQLVQLYTTYQQGQAAVTKLRELLATEPTVAEAPDAVELPPIEGDLTFEGVSFAYTPALPEVLHGIDLVIAAGETVAFVGETGAGKSTLAKLVTRFYDPTAGRVLVDGHDLRDVKLGSLRRQLGVVPQEPFLFHGTMRDNLAFARPDATDDEVMAAAEQVGLGELLARLPAGVDTWVHERGASLSSGERQLLALGRALLARPRVLVLDEATSNLDLRSERRIEAALDAVREGRTAILIAHRLATAMRADRIVVVHDGRIIEVGPPRELIAAGGRFAALHRAWLASSTHDGPDESPLTGIGTDR
jgi:ATP-binding cassette subfamily B protein